VGIAAIVVAAVLSPHDTRAAASQVWSPFVLVAGLLLVGLVADQDGLFAAAGRRLASFAPNGVVLFAGSALLIAVVTALLNLDTSVVFVTPVLVYAARSLTVEGVGGTGGDGGGSAGTRSAEVPLLVACLLLSNAGSLLLPGSNLTNLIVLGHFHLSGGRFFSHMALPWVAAVVVTGVVIALLERRSLASLGRAPSTGSLGQPVDDGSQPVSPAPSVSAAGGAGAPPLVLGLGAIAVLAVLVLILALRGPALPVLGVGLVVVAARLFARRQALTHVLGVLGIPVLIGLFGIAVALGSLGRAWSGPARLLSHLDGVGTAVVAAGATVVFNNLPAASLLASRVPPHPFALLVGLNIGPNLFVTGSLAWVLWWRTISASGATAPVRRAVLTGLVTVPLAMAAALGMLAVGGSL
jgi:arsenical pump membrane protein